MNETAYYVILGLCVLGALLIYLEIRGLRKEISAESKSAISERHKLRNELMGLYAGLINVAMEHESRLSHIEGSPFKPAALAEKLAKGVPGLHIKLEWDDA